MTDLTLILLLLLAPYSLLMLFAHAPCSLLITHCSLLTAICSLLIALCSLLFALCSLLFALCSLLFAHCLLLFAHCSLLFAHCSLLTALCSLPFVLFFFCRNIKHGRRKARSVCACKDYIYAKSSFQQSHIRSSSVKEICLRKSAVIVEKYLRGRST